MARRREPLKPAEVAPADHARYGLRGDPVKVVVFEELGAAFFSGVYANGEYTPQSDPIEGGLAAARKAAKAAYPGLKVEEHKG